MRSVSVEAIIALRDACDDMLAHSEMGSDGWRPRADGREGGRSPAEAFERESLALGEALGRVIGEASGSRLPEGEDR